MSYSAQNLMIFAPIKSWEYQLPIGTKIAKFWEILVMSECDFYKAAGYNIQSTGYNQEQENMLMLGCTRRAALKNGAVEGDLDWRAAVGA